MKRGVWMNVGKEGTQSDTENVTPMNQQKNIEHPEGEGVPGTESIHQKNSMEQTSIAEMLASHSMLLAGMKSLLENRLSYDETKEKTIDKLHEEMKLYRDNFIFQSQKPVFVDLIMLYDNFTQLLAILDQKQDMTRDDFATIKQNLHAIKEEILEILHRRDVTPYHEHTDFLDYKLHKTIGTVPTSIESENNKVEKIVKAGFCWNDKVLRPEEVIIKKYQKE